jgi:hypothetical protein
MRSCFTVAWKASKLAAKYVEADSLRNFAQPKSGFLDGREGLLRLRSSEFGTGRFSVVLVALWGMPRAE